MKAINLPDPIRDALDAGATLAISVSGGKDSQATQIALDREFRERGWTGQVFAVHAHLGRMEWKQTLSHCHAVADRLDMPLHVVSRPQGDLLQEMQERMEKLRGTEKPHFPDAKNRYCTSDQKRGPIDSILRAPPFPDSKNRYCTSHHKSNQIDKVLRSPFPSSTQRYCTADQKRDQILKEHRQHSLIVSAMGFRSGESPARAKRSVVSVQRRITAKALCELTPEDALIAKKDGQRLALDWLPIFDWSESDVWEAMGHSISELKERQMLWRAGCHEESMAGWTAHPAYVMGNQRLSCAICILGSRNDIVNGAKHNPELYQALVEMELESGFSFRQDLRLADLDPYSE